MKGHTRIIVLAILVIALLTLLKVFPSFGIPQTYESVLDNGLRIILIPDSRVEMAVSYVIIGVGLRNETPDINGVTHLLEHMLFNGTTMRTQEELYDEADRLGAYNNAFTREDFTAFMILSPSKTFKQAVALQADMILNSTLPPEKFEKERGIVLEEINKDTSDPYYNVESAWKRLLWLGTPYEMQVLGPKAVISNIPREKVWNFYKKYYAPNNITLLLIGDFNPEEMLNHIKELYRKAVPSKLEVEPILPLRARSSWIEKRYFPGISPRVYFALPLRLPYPFFPFCSTNSTNPVFERDYPVTKRYMLEQKQNMTTSARHFGEKSRVRNFKPTVLPDEYLVMQCAISFVQERLQMYAKEILGKDINLTLSVESHPEASYLTGVVELVSADDAEIFANHLPSLVQKLGDELVDEKWLARRKNEMLADERKAYDNFLYYGMFRAYDINAGRLDIYKNFEEQVASLSPGIIQSFLNGLSFRGNTLRMLALPYPKDIRTQANRAVDKKEVLGNGLTVIVHSDDRSKVFGATVLFRNRLFLEPPGKNGIAEILMRIYSQGPRDLTEEDFNNRLSDLGLSIDFYDNPFIPMDDMYLSPQYSYIKAEGLDESWEENLEIISTILQQPKINDESLTKAKQSLLQVLGMKYAQPREIARIMFFEGFFSGCPLENKVEGDIEEVKSVTLDDLEEFKQIYSDPKNLILSVATSMNADQVLRKIEELFGQIPSLGKSAEWMLNSNQPKDTERNVGKEQSYIYFGYARLQIEREDKPALDILSSIISDKSAMVIREQKGLAYSIGAGFGYIGSVGWFSLAMGTSPENLDEAKELIRNVLEETKRVVVNPNELERVVNSTIGRMEMRRITRKNQAFYNCLAELTGEPYGDYIKAIKGITPAEVEAVREKYFNPEKGVFFIAK